MTTIVREDSTLKLLVFHGNGKEDPEQHWFVIFEFCKSMGHDIRNFQELELMRERYVDSYKVQEMKALQNIAPEYQWRPFNIATQGTRPLRSGGFGRGGPRGPIIYYNYGLQENFA